MKKWIIVLIFIFIFVFLIYIISGKSMLFIQDQEQDQESFTPYINSYYRPFVRRTRRHLESYPFPNVNRFYKHWGLL